MRSYFFVFVVINFYIVTLKAQSTSELLNNLTQLNIQLDEIDKTWLNDNNSFLIDMTALAKLEQEPMNKAVIQMSIKLLSNDLLDLSDDEAKNNNEQLTTIIYGALDDHGLENEKRLSVFSWYQMVKREIRL